MLLSFCVIPDALSADHKDSLFNVQYVSKLDDESNGGLAKWDVAQERWMIPRIDLAGNNQKIVQPIPTSVKGAFRSETTFSRRRKLIDKNPRLNHENILELNVDYPDPVAINYTGPNASKEIRIDVEKSCDEVLNTPYIWNSSTTNKVMK